MRQYWNLWTRIRSWLRRGWGWLKDGAPVLLALVWLALLVALWWWGPRWQWNDSHPLQPLTVRWALTVLLCLGPADGLDLDHSTALSPIGRAGSAAHERA